MARGGASMERGSALDDNADKNYAGSNGDGFSHIRSKVQQF